jgi:hypothetical protein|tara:strand:- start:1649 stop:1903 length:255 start_codon:yes stop_codon:yes gene_type:complete
MGSGNKKKDINMGTPPYKDKDWIAYRWCVKNNISISAKAKSNTEWYVDIINNGKTHTSPDTYGKNDIWLKIFEYSKYYYDKHRK